MTAAIFESSRLLYRPLAADGLADFHRLVVDEHVSRYLLDGATMDLAWCAEQLRASAALFQSIGVGLWLAHLRANVASPIGFCGFLQFAETGPHPQLTYAFMEQHTGQRYATEAAQALIGYAAQHTALAELHSAVDEPNIASIRVLENIGFRQVGSTGGAFGRILQFHRMIERD